MGRLKHCVEKSSFPDKVKQAMISEYNSFVESGVAEDKAAEKVVMNFHKTLEERLDKFKLTLRTKFNSAEIDAEPAPEVKPYNVEISDSERGYLLSEGYDDVAIDKAINEANEALKLPAKELFKLLNSKGVFNLGLTVGRQKNIDYRPDTGMSSDEYRNAVYQLENNKINKSAERLIEYINEIKRTGDVKLIFGSGGSSQRQFKPLYQELLGEKSNQEVGMTDQEAAAELEKESLREQAFAETGQFQKASSVEQGFQESLKAIRKAMPKVDIEFDSSIDGAGQVQGNTLKINPEYAGLDTPIHEAGHILIDAMGGVKNPRVKLAIKQLKDTDLWAQTAEAYPELDEDMLAKEVLAEAIGREGAGVFNKVVEQSKFKQFLNYFFDKIKQLFGIDKNVAKSLATQIISGIGTKNLKGTTEQVQQAKKKRKTTIIENLIEEIEANDDLSAYETEDLLALVSAILQEDSLSKGEKESLANRVYRRAALSLKERGIATAEEVGNKVDPAVAATKDITWWDKMFKVLSHFGDMFPEMKEFSKMWDSAYFSKMKEAREEKNTHDKLAMAVIKERNKKMGVVDRGIKAVSQIITDQKHKYFEYLDNGKGKLITVNEAKKKGYSDAQIKYLEYVRDLIAKRQEVQPADPRNDEMDVLKLDKDFYEKFQSEGAISALSNFVGTDDNLLNTKIQFTNPNTGKTHQATFREVQLALQKYSEKGLVEKTKSIGLLMKYGYKAKIQLKKDIDSGVTKKRGKGQYTIDEKGNLKSRFDTNRDPNRSYSKDFYSAVNMYIDDTMHVKHISKVALVANSLEHLAREGAFNSEGEMIQQSKKNLESYMKQWIDLHILQKPNENDPTLDKVLKGLRFLSSAVTMWFNVPANIMNVAIGNYNSWRDTDGKTWAKGQARLFGKGPRSLKAGAGITNKYAVDIIRKYTGVANDVDSSPIITGTNLFSEMAMLGQKWGEFQIQGSGLLGLMTDEEYNSFEYKPNKYKVDELVVKKGVDEKKLEAAILAHMNKVSDVQGKYSQKDRRNIMNNEMGKIAMQYKVWIPDWIRTRFNKETGSYNIAWNNLLKDGFKDIRTQLYKGDWRSLSDNKAFMQNLKGLATVGFLVALTYNDDEDDEKSFASKMFQKALSDVLFIFEPDNLRFTLKRPFAAMSVVERFIDAGDHLFAVEADDFYSKDNKYGDEGDSKLQGDIIQALPAGRKVAELLEDEEN